MKKMTKIILSAVMVFTMTIVNAQSKKEQIENLKFKELTKKNGKVSSAMLYDNEKYIVLMMGSNNLPSI